jgi:SAM-dependent methyltransferase
MLFVELALIRWLGSNVIYLSYFSNFVLLGSFLGIGVGFLRARSLPDFSPWAALELAFLVAFVLAFPVTIDRSGRALLYFGDPKPTGLPMWLVLPIVFLATATVMATIAQGVGRMFSRFDALEAYRVDILGSLAGIVAFSILSFLQTPPVVWGTVASIVLLMLYVPSLRMSQVAAAIALVLLLGGESLYPAFSWSPYYKIAVFTIRPGVQLVSVNGIPHQYIESMAIRKANTPIYFLPYARSRGNPLRNVLIIGAGNGGDVAIALAAGAKHVDAVEIDPRIYQLGRQLNPDHPYQNPNVTVHIDDGRAFLQRTRSHYDLILFALPDSLVLVPGQSSLRLESYLFTLEALRAARAHLNPGGVFAMYNNYREGWLIDRFARTLEVAYGHPPCIDSVGRSWGISLLTVGLERRNVQCDVVWKSATQPVPTQVSDDYPFPYLRDRSIPVLYIITLTAILLASVLVVRGAVGSFAPIRGYADLFFMGAAFLLLETKSVVQFALLFGTTWFVNALVFIGVLLAVLAAIEVSLRFRVRNAALLYLALFVALALAWSVEPEALLSLDVPARFAASVSLAFAPVFLANLVFAQRFHDVGASTAALGANLLGAMVGGVLEYSSLLLGYRNLFMVAVALYGLAFVLGRSYLTEDQSRKARRVSEVIDADVRPAT